MPGLATLPDYTFGECQRCDIPFEKPSWCPLCDECYEDTEEVADATDSP